MSVHAEHGDFIPDQPDFCTAVIKVERRRGRRSLRGLVAAAARWLSLNEGQEAFTDGQGSKKMPLLSWHEQFFPSSSLWMQHAVVHFLTGKRGLSSPCRGKPKNHRQGTKHPCPSALQPALGGHPSLPLAGAALPTPGVRGLGRGIALSDEGTSAPGVREEEHPSLPA